MADFEDDDFDQELLDLVSTKKRPVKKKRKSKKDSDEESEEDFQEEQPSSDSHLSSSDEDDDEDLDEGLLEDLSESELRGLTELEREARLSERAEKKQQLLEKMQIKKRLKEGLKKQEPKKRRRLDELKAKRQKKKPAASAVDEEEDYQIKIKSSYSSGGEKQKVKATLEHVDGARVSRDQLERWCYAPFFKGTVLGCFVRLMVGTDDDTRQPVYRICQIVDVVDYHRLYKFGGTQTKKALKLKHGKAERVFLMDIISNSNFTEQEFKRWTATMQIDKQRFPSISEFERHKRDLEEASQHVFSNEEVEAMIQEKRAVLNLPKNLAVEKMHLIARKEEAETEGREQDAKEIQETIEYVEQLMQEQGGGDKRKVDVWARLNERNRKANLEEGRQAEKIALQQRLSRKGGKGYDPFARIKVDTTIDVKPDSGEPTPDIISPTNEISPVEAQKRRLSELAAGDAVDRALAEVDVDLDL